ncbi:hypothetical protein BpHYR1_009214, partial [Brachionus plicatilis]
FASKEENKSILDEWKKLSFNQKLILIKQKYPNLSIDNDKSQINLTNIMVNDAEDFIKKNEKYKQLRKLIREQEANEDSIHDKILARILVKEQTDFLTSPVGTLLNQIYKRFLSISFEPNEDIEIIYVESRLCRLFPFWMNQSPDFIENNLAPTFIEHPLKKRDMSTKLVVILFETN